MLREILRKEISKVIGGDADFKISEPERAENGDFSTNAAFLLAKKRGQKPQDIAQELAEQLASSKIVKRSEAKNGFVNIFLKDSALLEELGEKIEFPKKKEKISLDYLDANPTGPAHIGHGRSGFFGDVLSNVLIRTGFKVSREFYVNNAKVNTQIRSLGKTALGRGEEYKHAQLFSLLEKPEVKEKLKSVGDEGEAGFYIASLIQAENRKFLEEKTMIRYDLFFEEEAAYSSGLVDKILEELKKSGAAYEKEGAIWLKSSEKRDSEDRVLVRSTGEPTYLLPDAAYHFDRLVKRKFNLAVNIFGADHHGYGPRLKAALLFLGVDPKRIHIIEVQTARIVSGGKEVKMSKRKGEFITLVELLNEVGLDAARWFFLARAPETHMDFDLDLAKERSEKNPVYYVQYAHTRMASILSKAQNTKYKILNTFAHPSERALVVKILRYPELLEDISKDYQVHRLTTYAYELAQSFSAFYRDVKVLGSEREAELLYLVQKAKETLADLLKLMGISPPEKM